MSFAATRGRALRSLLAIMREAGIRRLVFYPQTGCAALGNATTIARNDDPIETDPDKRAVLQARITEIENLKPAKRAARRKAGPQLRQKQGAAQPIEEPIEEPNDD